MKTKTLEDALFDTGAPDEIILLAMVEAFKQNYNIRKFKYGIEPFCSSFDWSNAQQGFNFWELINELYRIR